MCISWAALSCIRAEVVCLAHTKCTPSPNMGPGTEQAFKTYLLPVCMI